MEREPLDGVRRRGAGLVASLAGGRGGALIILLLLVAGFSIASSDFLSTNNLLNVLRQNSVPMIMAVGMTLESVATLGGESIGRFPVIAIVAIVCILIGAFILGRMRLGRAAYAVGGNPDAARMSGIDVNRTKVLIYISSGVLAAVAGFVLVGRTGSANALSAEGLELQVIAAVVIGGTNLFGGEGKVSGTVIGMLVIGVLSNGLSIVGVSEFWQRVVNGLIIVVVVALDQWRRRAARTAHAT